MEDAIDLMRERGATIVDPISLRPSATMRRAEVEVMAYEFKAGLNDYLAALPETEVVHSQISSPLTKTTRLKRCRILGKNVLLLQNGAGIYQSRVIKRPTQPRGGCLARKVLTVQWMAMPLMPFLPPREGRLGWLIM